jgi:hypothetical protein
MALSEYINLRKSNRLKSRERYITISLPRDLDWLENLQYLMSRDPLIRGVIVKKTDRFDYKRSRSFIKNLVGLRPDMEVVVTEWLLELDEQISDIHQILEMPKACAVRLERDTALMTSPSELAKSIRYLETHKPEDVKITVTDEADWKNMRHLFHAISSYPVLSLQITYQKHSPVVPNSVLVNLLTRVPTIGQLIIRNSSGKEADVYIPIQCKCTQFRRELRLVLVGGVDLQEGLIRSLSKYFRISLSSDDFDPHGEYVKCIDRMHVDARSSEVSRHLRDLSVLQNLHVIRVFSNIDPKILKNICQLSHLTRLTLEWERQSDTQFFECISTVLRGKNNIGHFDVIADNYDSCRARLFITICKMLVYNHTVRNLKVAMFGGFDLNNGTLPALTRMLRSNKVLSRLDMDLCIRLNTRGVEAFLDVLAKSSIVSIYTGRIRMKNFELNLARVLCENRRRLAMEKQVALCDVVHKALGTSPLFDRNLIGIVARLNMPKLPK